MNKISFLGRSPIFPGYDRGYCHGFWEINQHIENEFYIMGNIKNICIRAVLELEIK